MGLPHKHKGLNLVLRTHVAKLVWWYTCFPYCAEGVQTAGAIGVPDRDPTLSPKPVRDPISKTQGRLHWVGAAPKARHTPDVLLLLAVVVMALYSKVCLLC